MTENGRARFGDQWPEEEGGCRGEAPTKLDTQETSDTHAITSSYRDFLISGCKKDIDHAAAVYGELDKLENSARYSVLNQCKSKAWFVRNIHTGNIRVAASRCHLRWCPLCIKTKVYIITQSVSGWLKERKDCKFLTVTLKHNDLPLSEQVDRLYDCFRKLRRRRWFLDIVKGGIWFFQIKKSKTDGKYHPHIHFLIEGGFVPRKKLSAEWLEITGDSMIVDVRPVKDEQKAAEYVARYAAAPCRLADLSLESSVELVQALHSRRICGTWGTGSEIKLAAQKPEDAEDWEWIAGWSWVVNNRHTDQTAKDIMKAFVTDQPLEYDPNPPPFDFVDAVEFFDSAMSCVDAVKAEEPIKFVQVVKEYMHTFFEGI